MRINEDFFDNNSVEAENDNEFDVSTENIVLTVFYQSLINNKKVRIENMAKVVSFIERKGNLILNDVNNTLIVFSDDNKQNVSICFYIEKTQTVRNLYKFISQISTQLLNN